MTALNKVCLVVIDGWGVSPNSPLLSQFVEDEDQQNDEVQTETSVHSNLIQYDAIANAETPVMNRLLKEHSHTVLLAHGTAVGLPEGLMGNSEVGHLNIGAGRIVYQDIVRIDGTIQEGKLDQQEALLNALQYLKSNPNARAHFVGLVSDGGVHSHIRHLFGLLKIVEKHQLSQKSYIHFIGDGRDTSPKSAVTYVDQLHQFLVTQKLNVEMATITGRYYSMDRDKRWERTCLAYEAYSEGKGERMQNRSLASILDLLQSRYNNGETDEFLKPIIIQPEGIIQDNDVIIFFNYRSDRMRQLASSFIDCASFVASFDKHVIRKNLKIISMTQYHHDFTDIAAIFPPQSMDNVLAEWISKQGLKQCHIAETEKYAHVTFFFNGGREICFQGEDRILVPSPKVLTYDLLPEMSVFQVGEQVVNKIASADYAFIMCNLAPPDMVGHTGKYDETVKAVEATDKVIGLIYDACVRHGYTLFVTSDHGNAEKMMDEQDRPHTAHTTAPVPFIMASRPQQRTLEKQIGALCDVAPTLLSCMGLAIPADMTGRSLLS